MKKEKSNSRLGYILGGVTIVVLLVIMFSLSYHSSKQEQSKVSSVEIIDITSTNPSQYELTDCQTCLREGSEANCLAGSLKITFRINSNAPSNEAMGYYYTTRGVVYPSSGTSSGYSGVNIINYAFRDYRLVSQIYNVCVPTTSGNICSNDYTYYRPC